MRQFLIPHLHCPFPVAVHPQVDEIESHTNQWVLDFGLIEDSETQENFKASKFGHFIGRSFPKAEFTTVAAWSDLNALLFIVDDQIDGGGLIKNEAEFFSYTKAFFEVLDMNRTCTLREDRPTLAALSDFWLRIRKLTNARWQQKFIKGCKDMFDGGYWQFQHLLMRKKPSLDEYFQQRQYFGAAHLSTDALEGIAGIDVPQFILDEPIIQRLTELCRNAICFSNDLFSLAKEIEEKNNGGEFNLVFILKEKYNLTLSEAIQLAADIHDDTVNEFLELSGGIFKYGDRFNIILKEYVDALGILMRGNIEWSTKDTARYPHTYTFEKISV
ncbi:terpene synthase family protein [Dinghuibacter silviterrae]|uniref:Terpene synthase n=1 Tax=Dinghuibacter silviterrae TaxID=1539049 RepID=A0A4R8DGV2_9BACT|nr:hypothetical protein [Dinghuibacter silviterrae]TDW96903.1 hypothetical protein EDB95_4739 [Dinghuibacter silviterrae]